MPKENSYIASIASRALDKINIFKVKNITNTIKALKKLVDNRFRVKKTREL